MTITTTTASSTTTTVSTSLTTTTTAKTTHTTALTTITTVSTTTAITVTTSKITTVLTSTTIKTITTNTTFSSAIFYKDSFLNLSNLNEIYKLIPNNTYIDYFWIDYIVSNNIFIFNQLNQSKLELLYGCLTNCSGSGSCKLINFEIRCDCQKDFIGEFFLILFC